MSIFVVTAAGGGQSVQTEEVKRALSVLADPEHAIELRGLPSGRSHVLFGSDLDGLCAAAQELAKNSKGIYYCLNPIPPNAKNATVKNVIKRRWLLIDVDPVKGAGKDYSATDGEKDAARQVQANVLDYLASRGWPSPVLIDSGNGWHLLFRIDMPNDRHAQALIKSLIYALRRRFDSGQANIDASVHNAGRIARLPGTWAKKGPDNDDRPHRMSRLVHVPDHVEVVSADMILSATARDDAPKDSAASNSRPSPFNLKAGEGNSTAYAKRALDGEVVRVIMARPGGDGGEGRNNALNRAAFSLGQLVAGGLLTRGEVEDHLTRAAEKAGLDMDPGCGPRGIAATIASGLEAGMQSPRTVPERRQDASGSGPSAPQAEDDSTHWQVVVDGEIIADGTPKELVVKDDLSSGRSVEIFELYSLPNLLETDFPSPNWVVPGILSEGLNILAGKPKMGKSMLALNLAMTIAGGGMALQSIQTVPGDVLYLCLEDKNRRIQSRAKLIAKGLVGCGISRRLTLATRWPNQAQGGIEMLDHWMRKVERPTLVIIDVWGMFRPAYRNGSQYEQDYQHMSAVKQYLDKRECSSLVLHHCRKGPSEDALEEVSGTMGLTGVADGIMVLNRSRSDNEAKVFVTGRDVQEHELALQFIPETLTWKSLGSAEEHMQGKLQVAIIGYLKSLNGGSAFVTDIAQHLNEADGSVRKVLHRMFDKRVVRRVGRAWAYPGPDVEDDGREDGLGDAAEF